LLQANEKQKNLTKELSEKINEISVNGPTNSWLLDIENTYTQYKKSFKEIEIIDYVLKNIYNDQQLEELCCIKNITQSSSNASPNYNMSSTTNTTNTTNITNINNSNIISTNSVSNTTITKNQKAKITEKKKEKLSKYIAVYSN
jgi:hypothetical protein